jgi:hypothetical protein
MTNIIVFTNNEKLIKRDTINKPEEKQIIITKTLSKWVKIYR